MPHGFLPFCIPLLPELAELAEEGWRDSLIEAGAPGAKREPDRAKPQLMVRPAQHFAELTTPALRATPPLRGGESLQEVLDCQLIGRSVPIVELAQRQQFSMPHVFRAVFCEQLSDERQGFPEMQAPGQVGFQPHVRPPDIVPEFLIERVFRKEML